MDERIAKREEEIVGLNDDALLANFFNEHKETIANDGFTERVLSDLPQFERAWTTEHLRLRRWRIGLNVFGTIAGIVLMMYLGFFSYLWNLMQGAIVRAVAGVLHFDYDSLLVNMMLLLHRLPDLLPSPAQMVAIAAATIVLMALGIKQFARTYEN